MHHQDLHAYLICLVGLFIISVFQIPAAGAQERCEAAVARAVSVQGTLEVRHAGHQNWSDARLNDAFCPGDALRTRADSRAAVLLLPETVIRLSQQSSIVFTQAETDDSPSWLELLKGAAHFISRDPRTLKIITPFANAAIEGTEFLVQVAATQTEVLVFEGRVLVSNSTGSVGIGSGEQVVAQAGSAPFAQAVVRPRDAVHWTLYYPPVSFSGDQAIQLATQALSVGQVEEANATLDRVLALDADNGDALALKSIIALTQNDKAGALDLASRSVASASASAAAHVAMSYAQQAHYDLSGALTSLHNATSAEPENALAWARLAEIWLSVGDLDQGIAAAERASSINPDVARTQTVLGFAYLTEIRLPESMAAFEKAITLDQAAPLPRLGLGLAKIRRGELAAGRREIEIAVVLDPGNALIRSYMGKAYYEEKRDKLAATQYDIAEELDPNDPTPWFYDAIRKQTGNRPVEALHDLQTSIKLNDNRAVYRSRLQLDDDLAARSAGMGRIYRDLGFEQRALVQGWHSLNTDPTNYSAHRLLADSYVALPRHEIARVSELLQSQLLQPINLTPVQPQLAQSNLFILEGLGPSDSSFLEFNPLFTRNRLALQANGIVAGNDTRGNDLVLAGIQDNWSWSAGQFHYESDGFRPNNDQEQEIYDVFVQGALTYKTGVQAEYRSTNTEAGDLPLRFDPMNFRATERREIDNESFRLGLRHAVSSHSDILVSAISQDRNEVVDDSLFGTAGHDETDSVQAETQFIYRAGHWDLITGLGHFNADQERMLSIDLGPPFGTIVLLDEQDDIKHNNVYAYSKYFLSSDAAVILGASYDAFRGTIKNKNQFSPKIGIIWDFAPRTTFRVAALRALKRSLASNQTIEPTQVAGFNQFFDDVDGTESKRYGIALDHQFSSNLYSGIEFSRRMVDSPFLSTPLPPALPTALVGESEENFVRSYLYWTPHDRVSISAEYLFQKFDRDADFPPGIAEGESLFTDLDTHQFPLSIAFHDPSGWTSRLGITYVNQEGTFVTNPLLLTTVNDRDRFWNTDASIEYRLKKRRGLVSFGVRNLFDESFKYQDTDAFNPTFYPERLLFGRVTLAF